MNKEQTKEAIAVMQAYVDGKDIEHSFITGTGAWYPGDCLGWRFDKCKYRIKPKTIKYRLALMKSGDLTWVRALAPDASREGFIKWLSDWIEIEV